MKTIKYIILSAFALALYACKQDPDFKFGNYTDVEGYYPFFANQGALIKNVRPHSGKKFQIQLNYYSKTPVSKIELLGKTLNGRRLPKSSRYKDLKVIKQFTQKEIASMSGFSTQSQVDTLVITWEIPSEMKNNASYVYYRIAVENVNSLKDTTNGDYWQIKPLSKEASLKFIYINSKSIGEIKKGKFEYSVNMPAGTTEIPDIKAVPKDLACSNIAITKPTKLKGTEAERTATIKIIAEDESISATYKIIFNVP